MNGKDYCPICQCFLKKEITRLGNIAKNGVTSLAGDNRVDEPSSKNCEQEVDPSVPETTYSDFTIQISVLVKEILDLQPPMLNKDVHVFSNITNFDSNTVYMGPNCMKCGHEVKGHKGKKNEQKLCPSCPNGICDPSGKSNPCKCCFHFGLGMRSTTPVASSSSIFQTSKLVNYSGAYKFLFSQQVSQVALTHQNWSNACTVISLYTGISFLNNEVELPSSEKIDELATKYKDIIVLGNGVYENIINLPGRQFNVSVSDIISQIHVPIKDPGHFQGIAVDHQAVTNFNNVITEVCKTSSQHIKTTP